ncbi:MAG: tetratricopeptide repeat protein, partial [Blastocatellia bacterium]|nr:tetratricopeptide repeat protein [Blastocatellia bacterium]
MKRLVINSITQMLIVMGVLISTPANSFILQNNKEIKLLEMDKVVERELKGDERHSYTVEAIENQYLRLSVMQKGVDVVVKVYDPDGKEVFEVDSPNGTEGEEPVEIVTEKKGFYKLEVASLEKTAPTGKYEVKLQEQRRAEEGEGEKIKALQKAAEINTKAGVLYQQSKYNEVEPLLKKVLEIRKKVVGLNHPDTATSLNNLAEVYRSQGRYVEAEPLLLQALEIRKTVLGLNHPDIAQSLNNLALLYYSRGRYVETESLLKQAVEV